MRSSIWPTASGTLGVPPTSAPGGLSTSIDCGGEIITALPFSALGINTGSILLNFVCSWFVREKNC